jgi:hypothetical protein
MATWVNGFTAVFSMIKLRIAVIAEDNTDCAAIQNIIHRVLDPNISTKTWASKGCSHLRRKLSSQLSALSNVGCNAFVIVHDLDRNPENGMLNDEAQLRKQLTEKASASKAERSTCHICIPIEELEAWFWSDPDILSYVSTGKVKAPENTNLKRESSKKNNLKVKASENPHLLVKPKEKLKELSSKEQQRPRYSTNMNAELAKRLNLELCAQRCGSFRELLEFLNSLKP